MTHKAIDKLRHFLSKLGRFFLQLLDRCGQAMRETYILSLQLAQQFHIVIAGDTESTSGPHGTHNETKHVRDSWTSINQVTQEYHFATQGMRDTKLVLCVNLIVNLLRRGEHRDTGEAFTLQPV